MKKERFKKVLKAFKKRSFYVFIFCNLFATFLYFACNITAKLIDNIYKRKNHYVFKDNWYIINTKKEVSKWKRKVYMQKE